MTLEAMLNSMPIQFDPFDLFLMYLIEYDEYFTEYFKLDRIHHFVAIITTVFTNVMQPSVPQGLPLIVT